MYWGHLRRPTIEGVDKDRVVAVVPLGSMEQHGRHLPVLTDTILVSEVADRVHAELGDEVLLLPTLWLGASDHHRDFPGTISADLSLYARVVRSIAESVLAAGFRRIFFLNGHGGNEVPAAHGLQELANECDLANEAYVVLSSYWALAKASLEPEIHGMRQPTLTHACEYETSMMLFLRSDLVAMAEASANRPVYSGTWWHSEAGGAAQVFKRFAYRTPTGSMGFPDQATDKKGQSLLEAMAGETVAFIKDFATWPPTPKLFVTKSDNR